MVTIQDIEKAKIEIKKYVTSEDNIGDAYRTELQNIDNRYISAKRKLEDAMSKEISVIEDTKKTALGALELLKKSPMEVLATYNKLMELFHVKDDRGWKNGKECVIYKGEVFNYYSGKDKIHFDDYDSLISSDMLQVYVYIVPNEKPVNKFSLILVGCSFFNEKLIKLPHSYGLQVNTNNNNIQVWVKDASEKEYLRIYYEKNKGKLLSDFIKSHRDLELDYKEASELYKDKDWQILYLEYRKNYYKNRVSRGTKQPEYRAICRRLKKLLG